MLDETTWQKCFKVSHTFGITKAMFVPIFYYYFVHSNDSHQCPILAADFVIFYYGTENEEAIQAGAGSE